ncbi:MAG TPA: 50S ribosomal protein L30 [Sphingomonadales bacterium]
MDVKITQIRSSARCIQAQVNTLRALGLRGIRKSVVRKKSPALDGMIRVVAHLVKVEEVK